MWPHRVEVAAPGLDDDPRLRQRVEDLAVEQLVAQPGVEGLNEAVLPRAAWRGVRGLRSDRRDPVCRAVTNQASGAPAYC